MLRKYLVWAGRHRGSAVQSCSFYAMPIPQKQPARKIHTNISKQEKTSADRTNFQPEPQYLTKSSVLSNSTRVSLLALYFAAILLSASFLSRFVPF
jgi:hypothetical protein